MRMDGKRLHDLTGSIRGIVSQEQGKVVEGFIV